jgi:aminobenzoyl-glutamate utilization protein B
MPEHTRNVIACAEAAAAEIMAAADQLWQFAEVGLTEHRSSAYLKDRLRQQGFAITTEGCAGMPTAFVAECGTGAPIIGILAEYDALPGLGNAAVARPEPRADGVEAGHGCGHNLIGSGALGAALALHSWLAQSGAPGTLRLFGCPAEENWSGKALMARAGVFDGLDAALHWHPLDRTITAQVHTTAVANLHIAFSGKTAHAGNNPWDGRSALHALELFAHGVNLMREHLRPTARVHYIFLDTGTAANVVPDRASLEIRFRDSTPELVADGVTWIGEIAEGAARATRTRAKVTFETGCNDILPNTPLAERTQAILESLGAPEYSDEEQAFARSVQASAGLPLTGMLGAVVPLRGELQMGGSSDVGDVSKIAPTMGFALPAVPEGVSLHTWAVTACGGMSIGHKAALQAAKVLAALAADLFTDAELRLAAQADFARRMGGRSYLSLLPEHATGLPDASLPDRGAKRAEDEFVSLGGG